MEGRIRITSAAQEDPRALLPRADSRAVMLRHLRKLESWRSGTALALDVDVAGFDRSEIKELCVADCFGFNHGIRVAFFEDVLFSATGAIWIVGFRREGDTLTEQKMRIYSARKTLIEAIVSGPC